MACCTSHSTQKSTCAISVLCMTYLPALSTIYLYIRERSEVKFWLSNHLTIDMQSISLVLHGGLALSRLHYEVRLLIYSWSGHETETHWKPYIRRMLRVPRTFLADSICNAQYRRATPVSCSFIRRHKQVQIQFWCRPRPRCVEADRDLDLWWPRTSLLYTRLPVCIIMTQNRMPLTTYDEWFCPQIIINCNYRESPA
jgi:hypothetical protein